MTMMDIDSNGVVTLEQLLHSFKIVDVEFQKILAENLIRFNGGTVIFLFKFIDLFFKTSE